MEYRWITVEDEYLCNGDSKYEKQKKQYSEDGNVWYDVEPLQEKRGDIIERYSVDCGYVEGTIVRPYTLINEAYFKAYCPVPMNFNIEEIYPFFNVAEELWLIDVLGVPLYNELIQQVNDNQVTPLNSTLLLKIYPYLSFAICYEALPFIGYHFSEVGVTKGKSENSDSVSINDMNYISNTLRTQVELLKRYLKKFLDDNAALYPLYTPSAGCCECKCEDNTEMIWNYYFFGGGMNKYDWERYLLGCMMKKDVPNPHIQTYSTPRRRIDIQ